MGGEKNLFYVIMFEILKSFENAFSVWWSMKIFTMSEEVSEHIRQQGNQL